MDHHASVSDGASPPSPCADDRSGALHLPHDSDVWFASTPKALTRALAREGCCEENAAAWIVPLLRDWRRVPPHMRRAMSSCPHVIAAAAALCPAAVQEACVASCRHGAANFLRAVNEAHPGTMRVHSRRGVFSCAFAAAQCDTADGMRAFVATCATSGQCRAHATVVCRFAAVLAYQWGAAHPSAVCSALMTVCCTPHFVAAGKPCMNALVRLLRGRADLTQRVLRALRKGLRGSEAATMASVVNARVLWDALRHDAPQEAALPAGWSAAEHAAAVAAARADD